MATSALARASILCVRGPYYECNGRGYAVIPGVDIRFMPVAFSPSIKSYFHQHLVRPGEEVLILSDSQIAICTTTGAWASRKNKALVERNRRALAALRAGINRIIIPDYNKKDLVEIPKDIRAQMEFIPVKNMDKILKVAFKEK